MAVKLTHLGQGHSRRREGPEPGRGQAPALRWLSILGAAVLLHAAAARADGAFPTEVSLFFPAGQPNEVVLATTFGLLVSQDRGASFQFACEAAYDPNGTSGNLYQVADDGTIFADTGDGLFRSSDGACNWSASLPNVDVVDAAFDPTQPGFALALTSPSFDQGAIVATADDGQTFGPPLWQGNAALTGVEFSRSQPGRVYVTGSASCPGVNGGPAFLLRSDDRGQSWTSFDLSSLGVASIRIAAVDPTDAQTVYFRVIPVLGASDWLFWTHDGGKTVVPALALPGRMSAFLRASDGTLYVATRTPPDLWRLDPGAASFVELSGGTHFYCLGEGLGSLWGCGDDVADKMALGTSSDRGASFCPSFTFNEITGLVPNCGNDQTACAGMWSSLQGFFSHGGGGDGGVACLDAADGGTASGPGSYDAGTAAACVLDGGTPVVPDAGFDAGSAMDAGSAVDAGASADASVADAGTIVVSPDAGGASTPRGCGCGGGAAPSAGTLLVLTLLALTRRRTRV